MAKQLHVVKLAGVVAGKTRKLDRIAKTSDAAKVWYFGGKLQGCQFKVYFKKGKLMLKTSQMRGGMTLTKHATQNYWYGNTPAGNKVQVSLKKIVGEIRWWA